MSLAGKTVLVTGATGGIGKVLCSHLVKEGANLELMARDERALETLSRQLKCESNGSLSYYACDFKDYAGHQRLNEQQTVLDGLVIMPPQPAAHDPLFPVVQEWALLFENSFIGPLKLIEHLLPRLKLSPKAKIVIVSGITSVQVLAQHSTSPVIRAAWRAEAKVLSVALGQFKISVNTVSFGGVLTDVNVARLQKKANDADRSFDEQMLNEVSNVPLAQYATPQMAAQVIGTYLSDFADHITGNNVICDGGFTRCY